MEGTIEQRKQNISNLAAEKKELQEAVKDKDRVINSFTNQLNHLVTEEKDLKLWPGEIRRLYQTHVHGERDLKDRMPLEEAQVQMRHAERRINSLAVKNGALKEKCKTDIQRKA